MKLKVCQAIWMPNEWWSKDGIILCRGPSDWPAVLAGIRSHSDMSVCLPPQRSVVGCVHAGFFLSNLVLLSSHLQFAGIFSCEFGVFLHIAIWCYLFDPGRGQGQVGVRLWTVYSRLYRRRICNWSSIWQYFFKMSKTDMLEHRFIFTIYTFS